MNLLWLIFDNGNDENGKKRSFKGIEPCENGYRFDNRFIVDFDKDKKIIHIKKNKKFVKLYNNALTNISCIVGKNGSGKTTFFELIISNIAWGMNRNQPEFLLSLYYEIKNDEPEFFIQLYRNNAKNFGIKVFYEGNEIYYQSRDNNSPYKTNMIPNNSYYIFHSLSPFDKIFYSIALPLKDNENRIKYFVKQMDYIGIQKMFSHDFKYEINTIANFIFMFKKEFFKHSFVNALNLEYEEINVHINDEKYEEIRNKNKEFFDDIESIIEKLNEKSNDLSKFKNLSKFVLLNESEQKRFFKYFFEYVNDIDDNYDKLKWLFILDNINFNKFINNYYQKNIENFLNLLNFGECIVENNKLNYDCISNNFLKLNYENRTFLNKNLNRIFDIEKINIFEFVNKSLLEIEQDKLIEFLKIVRYLSAMGFIKFEIYLNKNGQKINYFYLSSGEKTLISYFANIVASIYKFTPLKNKTFIILIDEVELHLHPEWQRRFINYINDFFKENNLNVKFQFIIATHSPFILSDIVDEQIIYIKDRSDLDINTFGANIYDIFDKGFFLENSIGKYSEDIIKAIDLALSFYQAINLANKGNIFVLRKLLNKWYISENGELNNKERERQDKSLLDEVNKNQGEKLKEIFNRNNLNIDNYKFLFEEDYNLSRDVENYINIIGDSIIKNHLLAMYKNIRQDYESE